MTLPLPDLVAHADWSVDPRKRWIAIARRNGDRYRLSPPAPVGDVTTLVERLGADGSAFIGLDLPLRVPRVWAARARIASFPSLLGQLGQGAFEHFARPAQTEGEIRLERPFYPHRAGRKGSVAQAHLIRALGLDGIPDLYRRCDLAQPGRARASPVFWTLGAKQVGRAALAAWQDLIRPSLGEVRLWPFAGDLDRLLSEHRIVIAETYPAEAQVQLALALGRSGTGSKRRQADRLRIAPDLLAAADRLGIDLEPAAVDAIETGFGGGAEGEDRYDSTIGLLGMLHVLRSGHCPLPDDPAVRQVEGWILGQSI